MFFLLFFTSVTSTSYSPDATEKNSLENNKDWVLIGTTCVVFIITCFAFVCVIFIKHREGKVGFVRFSLTIFSFEIRYEHYSFELT